MTVTMRYPTGYPSKEKTYKIYAVKELRATPDVDGVSCVILKNGKREWIRNDLIENIKEGRK